VIQRTKQSVELLPGLTEQQVLEMFKHILATPYGNGVYNVEKTEHVLTSCIRSGHLSVLEHANISMLCVTNIGTYKDYTRHRHCAFTIESTAFTKYDDTLEVITTKALNYGEKQVLEKLHRLYLATPSQKIARDFLPQCCAATMVMTTNIREWRHIISVRGDPTDNPLTKELRNLMWHELNNEYPFFFPIGDDNVEDNPMCIYNAWGDRRPAFINY
jgi:thymidylate synthase (FAD)